MIAPAAQVALWPDRWPPRVKILIPGINTDPDDPQNWAPTRADEIMIESPDRATEYRYATGALTRRLRMGKDVAHLTRLIRRYYFSGYQIDIIAHSHGTVLALAALQKSGCTVRRMDLIASALDPDCRANGLNQLADELRIHHLVLYVSANDLALKWGRILTTPLHPHGLGYHDLGYRGPTHQTRHLRERTRIIERRHTHSGWLREPETWAITMSENVLMPRKQEPPQ
jgi:hypothetical protein